MAKFSKTAWKVWEKIASLANVDAKLYFECLEKTFRPKEVNEIVSFLNKICSLYKKVKRAALFEEKEKFKVALLELATLNEASSAEDGIEWGMARLKVVNAFKKELLKTSILILSKNDDLLQ